MELDPMLDQGVKVHSDACPCQVMVQQAEEQWQELACSKLSGGRRIWAVALKFVLQHLGM